MSNETMDELPMTLQHYPVGPGLRPHAASYFSIDGPADAADLRRALATDEAGTCPALLVFDLGTHWWTLTPPTTPLRRQVFVGPVFGALLAAGAAARLRQQAPDEPFATDRLGRELRAAPSTAFRIVAMDRFLRARLASGMDASGQ